MKEGKESDVVKEKYGELKENLLMIGLCANKNRLLKNSGSDIVAAAADDGIVWLYDVFLQLSMLELSCTGEKAAPEQIAKIKEFAADTGHEDLFDVVQKLYGEDYRNSGGADGRAFRWDDVLTADVASVRRMVVCTKKDLRAQADAFCYAYAVTAATNGDNSFDLLKDVTAFLLADCVAADGEITPEEEDKLESCFIVSLINDIARRLTKFSLTKKS